MLHVQAAIWKGRGLRIAKGPPVRHQAKILELLEVVQLPKEVAVIHCRGHQRDHTTLTGGKTLVNKAGEATAQEQPGWDVRWDLAQWLRLHVPNAGGPGSILGQGTGSHMAATKSSHAAVKDSICHNKRKKRMLYAENKTQSCQINKYIFLKNQALQAAALIVNSPPSPVMPSYTLKNSSGLTMGMEEASRGG